MSHSQESSSESQSPDKFEKNIQSAHHEMSETAVKQWQEIRKLLPSHLLSNDTHNCFSNEPILPEVKFTDQKLKDNKRTGKVVILNQTNSEQTSFKDQAKELANSSLQFGADYVRGISESLQGVTNNLRDFSLGFADGASGTVKGTVQALHNPGETIQNLGHTVSTDAQYLTHTPVKEQIKDLQKSGLAAEQGIIKTLGHPLTAREMGKILGEHIYWELPIIPKIFKR